MGGADGVDHFPSNIPGVVLPSLVGRGVSGDCLIAHKGAVAGAKAMAASAIDLFVRSANRCQSQGNLQARNRRRRVSPFTAAGPKAAAGSESRFMERYRPAMREYYSKERPEFR